MAHVYGPPGSALFFTQKGSYGPARCRARLDSERLLSRTGPYRSKKPALDAWQQLDITVETAPAFGIPALNIGVRLGDKFGSADIDLRMPQSHRRRPRLIPEIEGVAAAPVLPNSPLSVLSLLPLFLFDGNPVRR
jgi:hypothetical protein